MLLRTSTEQMTLAVFPTENPLNQRRRKAEQREHLVREEHEPLAEPVKNFRNVGDVEKDTAGL